MPDSAFSHKCTPILNLSKKGVRGESRTGENKWRTARTECVQYAREMLRLWFSINASIVVYIKCSG